MSNMVGADIGELRELAAAFNARSGQLKSIEAQLNWRIHSAPWKGNDVSRFVHDWNNGHRRVILAAATSIASAAQDLMANAEQQERASSAGYTGGVPTVAQLRRAEESRIQSDSRKPQSSWLGRFLQSSQVSIAGVALGAAGWYKDALDWAKKARRASVKQIQAFIRNNKVLVESAGKVGKFLGITGAVLGGAQFASAVWDHRWGDAAMAAVDVGLSVAMMAKVTPIGLVATAGWLSFQGTKWFLENTSPGKAVVNSLVDAYFVAEDGIRSGMQVLSGWVSRIQPGLTWTGVAVPGGVYGSSVSFVESVLRRPLWHR